MPFEEIDAPNSYGGPQADPVRAAEMHWYADAAMVRAAYKLPAEDDDRAGPAPWCVSSWAASRENVWPTTSLVMLRKVVKGPVLSRLFECWSNVDPGPGKTVEEALAPTSVAEASSAADPSPRRTDAPGMIDTMRCRIGDATDRVVAREPKRASMSIGPICTAQSAASGGGRDGHVTLRSRGNVDLDVSATV